MEANELRIGNYIDDHCGHPLQITSLSNYLICSNNWGFEPENAKPIILTEDILLKAGFEKYQEDNHNGFIYGDTPIYCHWDGVEFVFQYAIDADLCFAACEFVHQLQNLMFCLIGKELEITF
jgi:hypothetical protein